MRRDTTRATTTTSRTGTAVLVAADAGDPHRACVVGELVWISDLCPHRPCRCEWGFNGVATTGVTMLAEVRRLRGIGREAVEGALLDAVPDDGERPQRASAAVARVLGVAAALPDGTLLRLEQGAPVPFPPGSRVVGPGAVRIPAPRDRW